MNLRSILLLAVCATLISVPATGQDKPIAIRAGIVIDGQGKVLRNATVVVSGRQIERVAPTPAPARTDGMSTK